MLTVIQRREQIRLAAYTAAKTYGFTEFNRKHVAGIALCSTGCVSTYFGEESLRIAALKVALDRMDLTLLKHAVVGPYTGKLRLPKEIRKKVIQRLAK